MAMAYYLTSLNKSLTAFERTICAVDFSEFLNMYFGFYPRDAMLARVIEIATCLSVRLSVCLSVRHAPVLCQNEES